MGLKCPKNTLLKFETKITRLLQAAIPKQYLELCGRPIATYSLLTFSEMPEVGEVVIVCDPSWKYDPLPSTKALFHFRTSKNT